MRDLKGETEHCLNRAIVKIILFCDYHSNSCNNLTSTFSIAAKGNENWKKLTDDFLENTTFHGGRFLAGTAGYWLRR